MCHNTAGIVPAQHGSRNQRFLFFKIITILQTFRHQALVKLPSLEVYFRTNIIIIVNRLITTLCAPCNSGLLPLSAAVNVELNWPHTIHVARNANQPACQVAKPASQWLQRSWSEITIGRLPRWWETRKLMTSDLPLELRLHAPYTFNIC